LAISENIVKNVSSFGMNLIICQSRTAQFRDVEHAFQEAHQYFMHYHGSQ